MAVACPLPDPPPPGPDLRHPLSRHTLSPRPPPRRPFPRPEPAGTRPPSAPSARSPPPSASASARPLPAQGPEPLPHLHRHRPHPGGRVQAPRPHVAAQGLRHRRPGSQARRFSDLRVHRLSRLHRRRLRPGFGEVVGVEVLCLPLSPALPHRGGGGRMARRSARQAGKMLRYRASLITPPPSPVYGTHWTRASADRSIGPHEALRTNLHRRDS